MFHSQISSFTIEEVVISTSTESSANTTKSGNNSTSISSVEVEDTADPTYVPESEADTEDSDDDTREHRIISLPDDDIENTEAVATSTPNKKASEAVATSTLNEKASKRKRSLFANPDEWKSNCRKRQRMSGKEYTTREGKVVPAKVFTVATPCNCRFDCNEIDEHQQSILFHDYYSLGDAVRQKAFLSGFIIEKDIQRSRSRNPDSGKKKKKSRFYHLPASNGDHYRVCQSFILKLFQISKSIIEIMLSHKAPSGLYVGIDNRIGNCGRKTKLTAVEHVKKHIDSFPRMESHYCRKSSQKLYLDASLSVSELYRLYVSEYCVKNEVPDAFIVKQQTFR